MAEVSVGLAIFLASIVASLGNDVTMPGDSKYRVTLLDIVPAEGTISPAFEPEGTEYTIHVSSGAQEEIHLALMMDLLTYSPRHCPKIEVDGQLLKYSPLDQVSVTVKLGSHDEPLEKDVVIRVADPEGGGGGLMGFVYPGKAHEYTIHIIKPPRLNHLVAAKHISVKDDKGKELSSNHPIKFDTDAAVFKYIVKPSVEAVFLSVSCPMTEGVSQLYDGVSVATGANKTVDLSAAFDVRTHVTCSYTHPKWAAGTVSRTYVLEFAKHVDAKGATKSISAELVILPQYGYCDMVGSEDRTIRNHHFNISRKFGNVVADVGFSCRTNSANVVIVATYSSTDGSQPMAKIVNSRTATSVNMPNAMPEAIVMPESGARQYMNLRVQAGDLTIVYPVVFLSPGKCTNSLCPHDRAVLDSNPFQAKGTMCLFEKCGKDDVENCCHPKATCDTYAETCPPDHGIRSDAADVLCTSTQCSKDRDEETCCTFTTTTTFTETTTTITTETTTRRKRANARASTTRTITGTKTGTSTTTTTTTVTTTTTLFCILPNEVWLPLDMNSTRATVEPDSWACQRRCRETEGCEHFAFWLEGTHCHLQDGAAMKQQFGYGFESGPPKCTPSNTVTTTTTNPIPSNQNCIQVGVLWSPYMGTSQTLHGSRKEIAADCQRICAVSPGCARFVVDFTWNLCRLAGIDAQPLQGVYKNFVSGPPSCDGVYAELGEMVSGSLRGVLGSGSRASILSRVGDVAQQIPQRPLLATKKYNWNCIQWGLSYVPMMDVPKVINGEPEDIADACETRCQQTTGCKYFTLQFAASTCQFAGEGAQAAVGFPSTASGPRQCDAAAGELAILGVDDVTHSNGGALEHHRWDSVSTFVAVASLSSIVMSLVFLAIAVHRRPRSFIRIPMADGGEEGATVEHKCRNLMMDDGDAYIE